MSDRHDFSVPTLGERKVPSPLGLSNKVDDDLADYTCDDDRIVFDATGASPGLFFERAGPRERIFFRSEDVTAGIVTCGGLCPGMNNVVRALVRRLWFGYGARRILGFRYGFLGMTHASREKPLPLDPDVIHGIHRQGGTMLGSSRGPQEASDMVDYLDEKGVNLVFAIGGDGTMRGAQALFEEVSRRGLEIGIVGVPKTIDNDIQFIEKTFGFDTAVAVATGAIDAARVEAIGASHGIGLVRLMGRHSGFIAASAAIASREVNLVLVPELSFDLHGERGILQYLRWRLETRGHAVVVVAEGAGQNHLQASSAKDLSGNVKLGDIGIFLRDTFTRELQELDVTVKYIDPSYMVRAAPANPSDAIFCGQLAEGAVHAAMAGKTGLVMGYWLGHFTHVPLKAVSRGRKVISLDGPFWRNALEATGQPMVLSAAPDATTVRG
ncbi:MAG: ATP-dependent 6-phosphofructokinase [Candidatus Wallbacteria bacterium]|nr:ATP-dependent 6-phosphofructokinase [Candidatus Wallbacteria bacterium]